MQYVRRMGKDLKDVVCILRLCGEVSSRKKSVYMSWTLIITKEA